MTELQVWTAVAIFAATYAVIAFAEIPWLRLDRAGAAVCGAVLMVACGVLTFDEAWHAVDARTIVLLLGMMILNVLLEESGFFELAASRALAHARSPLRLLTGITVLSAVLSALFLNDTVCLMLTLPVLAIVRRAGLPTTPYLIGLATSANIGSVVTLIGNPQNMLIGNYSGISYAEFLLWMAPVGILSCAVLVAMLNWLYGARLNAVARSATSVRAATPAIDRALLRKSCVVLTAVMAGFVLVGNLPLVAMCGAGVLMLVSGRTPSDTLRKVNWVLLAFFAGLFIVVHGLERTGLVKEAADAARPLYGDSLAQQIPVFSVLTVVGSNIVSNVPLVVLAREIVPTLLEPKLMWLVLAMASTLAGNLTIPGSVATLIVLETARQSPQPGEATVTFGEFLRLGIPLTLVTTALGALVLYAEHWLWKSLQ